MSSKINGQTSESVKTIELAKNQISINEKKNELCKQADNFDDNNYAKNQERIREWQQRQNKPLFEEGCVSGANSKPTKHSLFLTKQLSLDVIDSK